MKCLPLLLLQFLGVYTSDVKMTYPPDDEVLFTFKIIPSIYAMDSGMTPCWRYIKDSEGLVDNLQLPAVFTTRPAHHTPYKVDKAIKRVQQLNGPINALWH